MITPVETPAVTTPAEFKCATLSYEDFKRMEDVVKTAALISRNRNWNRDATLVTDGVAYLEKDKRQYVANRLKQYAGGLWGVTWSRRNDRDYQMWLNPELEQNRTDQEQTTLHELCHAMVATGTSHDESFRKLLHRSLWHWNELMGRGWLPWDLGWKCVEKYTERRANNYLEDRYGYESLDEYHDRIQRECQRAETMAHKEHVEVMKTLHDGFGWNV